MIIKIHPENPDQRKVNEVVKILKKGGVIIYPTDSVYALGCDINNPSAVEKVCKLKGWDPTTAMLTFMCTNISQLSEFSAQIPNNVFKIIKKNTPGPTTFILPSNNKVPKLFKNKKRTIGARICDHDFIHTLIEEMGSPILSTSLKQRDSSQSEYFNAIDQIENDLGDLVDAVVDAGDIPNVPTTVVDCTGDEIEIIREGSTKLRM